MSDRLRVAIVAPGHPELSTGSTEQASYAIFRHLSDRDDIEPIYVARARPDALGHVGAFASFRGRSNEILWSPPRMDPFRMVSTDPDVLRQQTFELFANTAPNLAHVHHYFGFGVEIIRLLRKELGLPVVVTLHEYLSICNNHGTMVKVNGKLCNAASPSECSACFPGYSSGKFFLRKELILENLSHADLFISPSTFLARRYAEWGIDGDRICVIENPLNPHLVTNASQDNAAHRELVGGPLRLGFFGQLTPFEGIGILLDAMALLDDDVRQRVRLSLFGSNPGGESKQVEGQLAARLAALSRSVANHGPYRNDDVLDLMRSVDWVVVPSLWWENSPIVIQEAKVAGVPILCSNIGGMQEKVRPGIDGAHFVTGNSVDLANKIKMIVEGTLIIKARPQTDSAAQSEQIVRCYRHLTTDNHDESVSAVARSALLALCGKRKRPLPAAERLVIALYGTLSETQRQEICFEWNHVDARFGLVRGFISNHWQVTRPSINGSFFTATQRALIRDIFRSLLDPEWYPRFIKQLADDTKNHPWGQNQSIAILGVPTSGPFQFVLCGRHLTLRADGGSAGHVAFGGPIVYGHAATGFNERPGHPGNIFWPQALAVGRLYEMLDPAQRDRATVDRLPKENEIKFRGDRQGIPVAMLTAGQKKMFVAVLQALLAPFRSEDRERVALCVERQGGLDCLTIALARPNGKNAQIHEEWRVEGPAFVWHFRGSPHVHVWAHVADHPDAPVNARSGAFLHSEHDPLL